MADRTPRPLPPGIPAHLRGEWEGLGRAIAKLIEAAYLRKRDAKAA